MDLIEKLQTVKKLGYHFVFSKTGMTIGDHPKFISIIDQNMSRNDLEKMCDEVIEKERKNQNENFLLLEKFHLIEYI